MVGIIFLMPWVAIAETASFGMQISAAKDLPDGGSLGPEEGATWGLGYSVEYDYLKPLVTDLVSLRGTVAFDSAQGEDRIAWDAEVEPDHEARLAWTRVSIGPEILVPTSGDEVVPFFGAGIGLGMIETRHPFDAQGLDGEWPYLQFEGEEAVLPPGAEIETARSRQLLPDASVWGGLRIWVTEGVAIDLESGYTVCHVPPSGLKARPYNFQVERSEFGLNVFRLGLGVTVGLPSPE